jgi:DNA polymerase (family 10)
MDNQDIARIFDEISDLLEIKGMNPFKIRAYRNAAETLSSIAERVSEMDTNALRRIPGIGKDLATRIQELSDSGTSAYHTNLLQEYPVSLLELLKLQGLGPKTVGLLYHSLGIKTIGELESATHAGRLDELRGFGPKKQALILRAIAERRRHSGRHLIADAHRTATAVLDHLRTTCPSNRFHVVGSLRRGCDTCGDVDILAVGIGHAIHNAFVNFSGVDRVLSQGETKSSILLRDGVQVDLRLVPVGSEGAALQYFTGSKSHNIALRDRAIHLGLKLNEYGLFRILDDTKIAGETEVEIYESLGLSFVPPELRENRGEIAAADSGDLPHLIERTAIRGDLHSHTTATDGRADIETMAKAAKAAGLDYLAITDHTQALAMANGLNETRALEHAQAIREVDHRLPGITLLAGIECDIRPDGTLDLSEDCLAQLDIVIASVHSAFGQEEREMTDRVLRAVESPVVDIIGHPTGRLLLRREPYRLNIEELIESAAQHNVALEINSQIHRLDLNDVHAKLARDRGVKLVVSTDAHTSDSFGLLDWGVLVARRAWLEPSNVLNTYLIDDLRAALRRTTSSRP